MAFFGLGAAEMLFMLLLSSGGNVQDAISLFPAQDYFKLRDIEMTPAKMVELASQEPTTAKAQIMQLQALRVLAQKPKLDADQLRVIRGIAVDGKAADKQGFAKEYAHKVLDAVDGVRKVMAPPAVKVVDAITWFPADATITGAVDFRLARIPGVPPPPPEPVLWKFVPEKLKREILTKVFEILESTGNVSIYRGALAVSEGARGFDDPKIYARLSGKFNREWIMKTIKDMTPLAFEEKKAPTGDVYHHLSPDASISLALLSDNEFLLAGGPRERGKTLELIEEMLAIKAGKKDSLAKGKRIHDLIAKVPDGAIGFLAADMPRELKEGFGFIFGEAVRPPDKLLLHLSPALRALDIQLEGVMANEDDAKFSVKGIFKFREDAIAFLKKEGAIPLPGFDATPLIRLVESVQVEAKGRSVHVRLLLPEEVVRNIVDAMMRAIPREFPEEK